MKRSSRIVLLCSITWLVLPILPHANAQEVVKPVPEPPVLEPSPSSTGAQETHDGVSVQQLTKLVELSRLIGGAVSQMFESIQSQKQILDLIRVSQTGPKSIPLLNGPDESKGREGGLGLNEMADAALNGAAKGPDDVIAALQKFRTSYNLDKAFAFKDDESISKALVARASAQGAIAASTAEDAYKRANTSMSRLDDYITALETSADIKTSVDINTRVMVEVAQQLNESLRTQAAIASTAGTYFMVMGGEMGKDDYITSLKNFNR